MGTIRKITPTEKTSFSQGGQFKQEYKAPTKAEGRDEFAKKLQEQMNLQKEEHTNEKEKCVDLEEQLRILQTKKELDKFRKNKKIDDKEK